MLSFGSLLRQSKCVVMLISELDSVGDDDSASASCVLGTLIHFTALAVF